MFPSLAQGRRGGRGARILPAYLPVQSNENENENEEARTCQNCTLLFSLLVQLGTLILSAIALSNFSSNADVLNIILAMETSVQCIEFAWYSVNCVLCTRKGALPDVYTRYWDWLLSTPVMLLSIFFFVLWDPDRSKKRGILYDHWSKILAIPIIIVCDWLMLYIGYVYEKKWDVSMRALDWIANAMLRRATCNRIQFGDHPGILLGFVPLIGAFFPIFVALGACSNEQTIATAALTFVLWTGYGVVAWLASLSRISEAAQNTAYNVLDIFRRVGKCCRNARAHPSRARSPPPAPCPSRRTRSKNVAGVLVSVIALLGTP